ncbi:hypothetical protein KI387_022040, partial [Taxus chinensis]
LVDTFVPMPSCCICSLFNENFDRVASTSVDVHSFPLHAYMVTQLALSESYDSPLSSSMLTPYVGVPDSWFSSLINVRNHSESYLVPDLIHYHLPEFSIGFVEQHLEIFFFVFASDPQSFCEASNTPKISVTFVNKDGEEKTIQVSVGMSMLEAAHQNDIELEGACEGSLACSTCHVIVMDENIYSKLEEPTDEENDMLDLAFGLTET